MTRTAICDFQSSTGARGPASRPRTSSPPCRGRSRGAAPPQARHRPRRNRPRRVRAAAAADFGGHRARGAAASGENGLSESRTANRAGPSRTGTNRTGTNPSGPIAQAPIAPAPIGSAIDLGAPEPPPAPPTSADIARAAPAPEAKTDSQGRTGSGRAGADRSSQAADAEDRGGDGGCRAADRGHAGGTQAGAARGHTLGGHRSRPARAAAGAANFGRHRPHRCVADSDRRAGDGDPAVAAAISISCAIRPTACTARPRARPSWTTSAAPASRRPARSARRCSNR